MVDRAKQQPDADRVFTRWTDEHRLNHLGAAVRRMAYQAAKYDAAPCRRELEQLERDIDTAEQAAHDLLQRLEQIAEDLHDLAMAVEKAKHDLEAEPDVEPLGFADDDELLDRLSRLYNIWPNGYRSHNGIWQ